jgi:ABC-2 type transport system ATP-binding protein
MIQFVGLEKYYLGPKLPSGNGELPLAPGKEKASKDSSHRFQAVHPLNFEVRRGEIFGFLGPNGAGKTTTIRMLMGLLVPSSGAAFIDGFDCQKEQVEVKKRVGYLPDTPIFYDYLRGHEILSFVAEMHGFSRAEAEARAAQMLIEIGLEDAADEFAINYSLGMKKRLGLAMAMIHQPDVLILDEPINGLDPRGAFEIQDKLTRLAAKGCTILLSTHLLDMAERMCSRVAIIDRGRLRAVDSPVNLRTQSTGDAAQLNSLADVFLELTAQTHLARPSGR